MRVLIFLFGFLCASAFEGLEKLTDLSSVFDSQQKGGKQKAKKNVCGDGVPDLLTEECDVGQDNGQPGSFCQGNCTFSPDAKCGTVIIDSPQALQDAQICRTANAVSFALGSQIDVSLPNLQFVEDFISGSAGNQMRSLTLQNLLYTPDFRFGGASGSRIVFIDLPSLQFSGSFTLNNMNNLERVSAPKLRFTTSGVELESLDELTTLVLDSLEYIPVNLRLDNCPKWTIATPFGPVSNRTVLELCSLPAFEVHSITNGVCLNGANCVVVGAGSDECDALTQSEGKDSKVKEEGGIFAFGSSEGPSLSFKDLSLFSDRLSLEKFGAPGGLGKRLEGIWGTDKEQGSVGKRTKKDKEPERCLVNPYPSEQPKQKEAPVCGNNIVEIGEECDGDEEVCTNECKFKETAICTISGFITLNSTSDVEALDGCAVIIGDFATVDFGSGAPEVFELPLLQALYGVTFSQGFSLVVKKISFPSAWKISNFQIFLFSGSSSELEEFTAPCGREFVGLRIVADDPPTPGALQTLDIPLVKRFGFFDISRTCAPSGTFDIEFPDLYYVDSVISVFACPNLRTISFPSLLAKNGIGIFGFNDQLESVAFPSMEGFDQGWNLQENPVFKLYDVGAQQFFNGLTSIATNNSPEGLEILLCELNAFQFTSLEAGGSCDLTADAPCFLKGAGADACSNKKTKVVKDKGEGKEAEGKLFGLFESDSFVPSGLKGFTG
uniref:Receptor L-domain domain-containing protein n=1 Tax=Chromera velia CCMP2878 TaxID=1169474 RepID=A0A0G4FKR7_9ALVE|eukprot:Cvel_17466.t1-p1 / transcript=Cvel_17466.t1 / gene=Cvel_17466 / organism=Chromera_velia_CCMP2878 / gene_product=hypothetical protein / transcript_product=hypothetical protein / location=Cvel_scaffold1395:24197-27547(-) / protein_length=720 / sequence_SO=supercontig / SO=protein_coding / is_pseudo=false